MPLSRHQRRSPRRRAFTSSVKAGAGRQLRTPGQAKNTSWMRAVHGAQAAMNGSLRKWPTARFLSGCFTGMGLYHKSAPRTAAQEAARAVIESPATRGSLDAQARVEMRPWVPRMRLASWHVFGGKERSKKSSQGS